MGRRLLLLLLTLSLVAAACGGGGSDGGDDEAGGKSACPVDALEGAKAPVALTYWYGGLGAGLGEAMQELIGKYNASQAKVKVTGTFQGTYDEAADKYLKAMRGGQLPQVVLLEDNRLQLLIDSKSVVPAQDCIDAANYDLSDHLDAVVRQFTVDDQLWPMPFNVSNPILVFDAGDFEKAGLDPADPPASFAEVLAAARKIKASGAAKTGVAWSMNPWYLEQWFAKAGDTIVDHENGRQGRAEKATLDTKAGRDAYEFVRTLFDEGLATNVGPDPSYADSLFAIGKGEASMALTTAASLGTIYAVQDAGQFTDVKVGVAPMYGPKASNGGVNVGGGSLWVVGRGTSALQRAASWDFARWLNEPEQQSFWAAKTGYIPIRKSAIDLPEVTARWKERPSFRVAYDQLAASKVEQGGPAMGPYREFRDAIRTSLERLVLKGLTPAAALAEAQKAADEALTSYNDRVAG
jgi:sn-glycerol 3-phosphate transport system substrate-binding protein